MNILENRNEVILACLKKWEPYINKCCFQLEKKQIAKEDAYQTIVLDILNRIKYYDPSRKTSIETYVYVSIKHSVLNISKKNAKYFKLKQKVKSLQRSKIKLDNVYDIIDLIAYVNNNNIGYLYFIENYTTTEISKKLNIRIRNVCQTIKRIVRYVSKELNVYPKKK